MADERAVLEADGDERLYEDGLWWLVRQVPATAERSLRILVRDLTAEDTVDPNFLDADYSIEAATGNQVWEGARELMHALTAGSLAAHAWRGAPVLELGAGTGLAGICAAALGAHACLTDVRAVASGVLLRNLELNRKEGPQRNGVCTVWGEACVPIGDGAATSLPLDWLSPVDAQLADIQLPSGLVVLAADCVWHADLLEPFVRTAVDLFRRSTGACAYIASWERAKPGSTVFVPTALVAAAFESAGCSVRPLESDERCSLIHVTLLPPTRTDGGGNMVNESS